MSEPKYKMTLSLNVLNHLGLNLYSNVPAVLSEAVANAYDADATEVRINIQPEKIIIKDNGHGMTVEDINEKYLTVGYQKRKSGNDRSPKYKRPFMGRKGIGKLSLFSIANRIEIHTAKDGEVNGFLLDKEKITQEIIADNEYNPQEIDSSQVEISEGTVIILTGLKKRVHHTPAYLRKRLGKRFVVIGEKFKVWVNDSEITLADRDYFKKIQFIWKIGDCDIKPMQGHTFVRAVNLPGTVSEEKGYEIRGWIGAVEIPSDLQDGETTNNKISIIVRGKLAQEDILDSYNEGGIYATYLIGEIEADFLDDSDNDDIATSSRQSINEDDERYRDLQGAIYKILKEIQRKWTKFRNSYNIQKAIEKAEEVSPVLGLWYNSLSNDTQKAHAKKLFATIGSLHFDKAEAKERKRELYKQGIYAFEKLRIRQSLGELNKIKSESDLQLAKVFTDLSDLEANLYYDIAYERVQVIAKFQEIVDDNQKEKILQKHLFDNLWLLNPSWERATSGTQKMEKTVEKLFEEQFRSLTEDERKGRLDIKYRTSSMKHIIVEMKRYKTTYSLDPYMLVKQVDKYRNALKKALLEMDRGDEPIESIVIMGPQFSQEELQTAKDLLSTRSTRVILYDSLIQESLEAYQAYLDKQKEVSKLRALLDKL